MEGTYPLPEAQLDRFFFKIMVPFPARENLGMILRRTISYEPDHASKVADGPALEKMIRLAREVPVASHVHDYAVSLILATHPEREDAPPLVKKYVRYGASPRGLQTLVIGGQVRALLEGRYNLSADDLQAVIYPALRHRLILNFEPRRRKSRRIRISQALGVESIKK
jgi:MoxR-like ATPase